MNSIFYMLKQIPVYIIIVLLVTLFFDSMNVIISNNNNLSCFFKRFLFGNKKSCSIFYTEQFLLFAAFVSLQTNIQLCTLSAARHEYLRLEKWRISARSKMNYIFKTQHCIVTMITENILLKLGIIYIEKSGNSIKFTRKHV